MDTNLKERQAEFSVAYSAFCRIFDLVDTEKYNQPDVCGSWSPKDVVSHLIGWNKSMEEFISNPECFDPAPLLDFESFNAKSVSDRQHQTWEETLHEMQSGYTRLQESIATVSAESKIYNRLCEWLAGRSNDYEHHTVQLRHWIT